MNVFRFTNLDRVVLGHHRPNIGNAQKQASRVRVCSAVLARKCTLVNKTIERLSRKRNGMFLRTGACVRVRGCVRACVCV
jgi:hypothetical protein